MKRLAAIRGAVFAEDNEADITRQVSRLYDEMLARNHLEEGDVIALFFTVTGDIKSTNPATALRKSGRAGHAALQVAQEAHFDGDREGVVRLTMLCDCSDGFEARHVYLNGAEVLRPDLSTAATAATAAAYPGRTASPGTHS